jgi:hypothetical protein
MYKTMLKLEINKVDSSTLHTNLSIFNKFLNSFSQMLDRMSLV